jgi:glycine betaine/choline ABC-type transport system substrate-binding protein
MMLRKLKAIAGLFGFVAASALVFKILFMLIDWRESSDRSTISIGSKAFTESIVLAEMMAMLIERGTDLQVIRRTNLGGTHICFQALRSGEIDLYPEYTGTGLMAILELPVENDPARALSIVKSAFEQKYDLEWLAPLAFNNTYALAMTDAKAARLGISSITDLLRHPELSAGFTEEFMVRKDGYPGLVKAYGLSFARSPSSMEAGLMYGAVAEGRVDVISAYATDGRIDKFALRVLEDDRRFFPPYQAAPLVRSELLERRPDVRAALAVLEGKLTDAEMRKINAEVDLGGRRPEDVAREWVDRLR